MSAQQYSAAPGWLGVKRQLLYYLRVIGARQDEQGNFLIGGAPIVSFLGLDDEDSDVLVPPDTYCLIGEHEVPIAPGLNSTSYRLPVMVLGVESEVSE